VVAVRKALLILLLPVVWIPVIGFSLMVLPRLPWWATLVALAIWFMLWRRRSMGGSDEYATEDGPRFAPIRAGGGY
jgi:Flp pilus assembly protein protease CpaA